MKEKRVKHKKSKKSKRKHSKKERSSYQSSTSSSSENDEWIEKNKVVQNNVENNEREDWMAMTGMFKTYTKDDIKPMREDKDKRNIDSYNPSTSSRELNPYWKSGGTGLPQTAESFRKSKQLLKPSDSDDYYSKPYSDKELRKRDKVNETGYYDKQSSSCSQRYEKSHNWRKQNEKSNLKEHKPNDKHSESVLSIESSIREKVEKQTTVYSEQQKDPKFLSDEKMNKLAAKILKAEILGDTKLVEELKAKLDAAREHRNLHPNDAKDDSVMLMSISNSGNARPLTCPTPGDPISRSGKRKTETHESGQRNKYFANDDKYDLAQMFQEEKYSNNYEDEAQLAKIAGKHTNPNDDLEDIFVDEISKNRNAAKDSANEKQRAINQHIKMEKSLEGCNYCIDSKNMLKHLVVSCGNKVYISLPAKQSLVQGQCIITTLQHSTCITSLDEDVWEEIMIYRKALTNLFNSQHKDVVFFETATKLHRYPHMILNCVPLPRDVGDMAAIYFKKALLECEAEWSMNKKVVELKGKNIRKGIPKGLPYFWIDFGMDPGFAHVIEDDQLFPKTFAEEVIGGMLDLHHNLWKNPRKEFGEAQRKKVLDFIKDWKPFDPTENKK